ncbi:hypothetical protein G7Y89_g14408 [Cudoniella acicularis]|uniref:Uncharacterized protein n=1 Tax=Cudoniella acicularis TaxID=354080 RepID=A0A8H4R4A2_9HELO|nr:hypothetical protein G7Y89_g14408 [Cudoniella acicularis]
MASILAWLPEEELQVTGEVMAEAPNLKGGKELQLKQKKGRTQSLGTVGEYIDEGDVAYQDKEAAGSRPTKRRKSAPNKRSKSSKVAENQTIPEDTVNASSFDCINHGVEEQPSQLTTPPDSAKRPKKNASSTAAKNKRKLPPFKSLTVTKPLPSLEEHDPKDELHSGAVIKLQEWTTTQDALKLNANGIAKTTIDKLTSFRYSSSSQVLGTETAFVQPIESWVNATLGEPDQPPPSSDYGPPPSVDCFFEDALRIADLTKINTAVSELQLQEEQGVTRLFTGTQTQGLEHSHTLENSITTHQVSTSHNIANGGPSVGIETVLEMEVDHQFPRSFSQQTFRSNDFSYDQAVVLNSREEEAPMCGEALSHVEEPETFNIPDVVPAADPVLAERLGADRESVSAVDGAEVFGATLDDFNVLSQQLPGPKIVNLNTTRPSDVLVEQSDIEDYDEMANEMAGDCDIDEFGEGLDDDDFLAIISDVVIPETQLCHTRTRDGESISKHPQTDSGLIEASESDQVVQISLSKEPGPADSRSLSLPVLDDEYPMSLEDEEMLGLLDTTTGDIEILEESESLLQAMEDEFEHREVYDSSLQYSPPKPSSKASTKMVDSAATNSSRNIAPLKFVPTVEPGLLHEEENWNFISSNEADVLMEEESVLMSPGKISVLKGQTFGVYQQNSSQVSQSILAMLDDSHEYEPLDRFVRKAFPPPVQDRCPIVGVSSKTVLCVCFRIGEMFREGAKCEAVGQDAVIELFARVTYSSREPGTMKQHFQFADLWSESRPFPAGILLNYKTTDLAESESKAFVGRMGKMARCLGRLKRDKKSGTGWLLHIINIRETDWEEIRWTKRIVSAGVATTSGSEET